MRRFSPNCGWLGADASGASRSPIASQLSVIEPRIEAGQDDRAIRQRGDHLQQRGRRRDRAGRTSGDDRTRRRCRREPRGLRADELVAPRRRIGARILGEVLRPGLAGDRQEVERLLPVAGIFLRRQLSERLPVDSRRFHVVDQPGEIARELHRVGSRGRDHAFGHVAGRAERAAPRHDQLRQDEAAFEPRDFRRQDETVGGVLVGDREKMLLLVDIADRPDARQQRRALGLPLDQHAAELTR